MTALAEAFAVLACTDWRAVLAGLFNLKGRAAARTRKMAQGLAGQGLYPPVAPRKDEWSD